MNNTNINKPKNASTLMGDFFPKRFLLYLDLVIFMVSKSETKPLRQKAEICLGHRLAGILESGIKFALHGLIIIIQKHNVLKELSLPF